MAIIQIKLQQLVHFECGEGNKSALISDTTYNICISFNNNKYDYKKIDFLGCIDYMQRKDAAYCYRCHYVCRVPGELCKNG